MNNYSVELGINAQSIGKGGSQGPPDAIQRGMAKGPAAKGNIAGTHYDPESANANRG
jgi:hypothetical protein